MIIFNFDCTATNLPEFDFREISSFDITYYISSPKGSDIKMVCFIVGAFIIKNFDYY